MFPSSHGSQTPFSQSWGALSLSSSSYTVVHKYSVFQGFLPSLFSFHGAPHPMWHLGRRGGRQTSFVVQVWSLPAAGLPCHVATLDLSLGIMDSGGAHQNRAGPISFLSRIMNIARVSSHKALVCRSPLSLSPDLSSSAQPLTGAAYASGLPAWHTVKGGRENCSCPLPHLLGLLLQPRCNLVLRPS